MVILMHFVMSVRFFDIHFLVKIYTTSNITTILLLLLFQQSVDISIIVDNAFTSRRCTFELACFHTRKFTVQLS